MPKRFELARPERVRHASGGVAVEGELWALPAAGFAAFVAALAYTYASIRLIHQGHFQLVVGGALVPLVLLLLLRMLEQPSRRRGIELGLGFATLTLRPCEPVVRLCVIGPLGATPTFFPVL